MAIDTAGKWWVGSSPQDLEEYLRAYSEDSYLATVFRLARCQCGSEIFSLEVDDDEGVARYYPLNYKPEVGSGQSRLDCRRA